ncbi:MAG: hypothetical protein QG596_1409 [Actinomycetota bacterium]|jgi:hypothetical protein|nr:hypothetical protein [Actinomycetota bacterium]
MLPLLAGIGALDGPTGLLMVAPLLFLFSLLLAGLYPGERIIEAAGQILNPRRRVRRSTFLGFVSLEFQPREPAVEGRLGSRAPPVFA